MARRDHRCNCSRSSAVTVNSALGVQFEAYHSTTYKRILAHALDAVDDGQRGEIRTVADFGPSPCMIGTAELPWYFSSYAASTAGAVSLPADSNVTS